MRLVLMFLTFVVFATITTPYPIGLEDSSSFVESESLSIEESHDISKQLDTSSVDLSNEKREHTVSEGRAPEKLPLAQNPFTPSPDLVTDGESNESSLESDETVSVENDKVGHRKSVASLESVGSSQSSESQENDENNNATELPKVSDDGSVLNPTTEAAEDATGISVQESNGVLNSEEVLNKVSHKDQSFLSFNSGVSSESNQTEDSQEHLKMLAGATAAETLKSDGVLRNNKKQEDNINSSESSESAASNESDKNVAKTEAPKIQKLPKVDINVIRQNIVNLSPLDSPKKTLNDSSLESSESTESVASSESNQNNDYSVHSKTEDLPKETTQSDSIPTESAIKSETPADDSNNAANDDEKNILTPTSSESSASSDESLDSDEIIKTNELPKDVPGNVEPAQQPAAIKANDGLNIDAALTKDNEVVQNIKSSSESNESSDSKESENNHEPSNDELKSSVTASVPTVAPISVPIDSSVSIESDETAEDNRLTASESGGNSESE